MRIAVFSIMILCSVCFMGCFGKGEESETALSAVTIHVGCSESGTVDITVRSNKPGATYTITVPPASGSLSDPGWGAPVGPAAYGVITTYTAGAAQGQVTFTYQVALGAEIHAAVVTIDVNNPATVNDPSPLIGVGGGPYTGTFTGSDNDGGSDTIVFHVDNLGSIPGNFALTDAFAGDYYWDPQGYTGVISFDLWISEQEWPINGDSAKVTVYMSSDNSTPAGQADTYYTYDEKGFYFTLFGEDLADASDVLSYNITVNPTVGTIDSFDAATGDTKYVHTGAPGTYTLQYTVSDGVATSAANTVTIDVYPPEYFNNNLCNGVNLDAKERFRFASVGAGGSHVGLINFGTDLVIYDQTHGLPFGYYSIAGPLWTSGNQRDLSESPMHYVQLSAFDVSRCEITNAQFAEFLSSTDLECRKLTVGYHAVYANHIKGVDEPAWLTFYGSAHPYYYVEGNNNWQKDGSVIDVNEEFSTATDKYFEVTDQEYWDHPVVNITWFGAYSYCQWLTFKNLDGGGLTYRLPTESQWERVAHGSDTMYPRYFLPWEASQGSWGTDWYVGGGALNYQNYRCNFADIVIAGEQAAWFWTTALEPATYPGRTIGTVPVGEFAVTANGLDGGIYDIIGNVWELIEEEYDNGYYIKYFNQAGGDMPGQDFLDPPIWNSDDWGIFPDITEGDFPYDAQEVADCILPQDVDNDRVGIRGGGWADEHRYDAFFNVGTGLDTHWIDGRTEMWRITDRLDAGMIVRANEGWNKIGFRIVRRLQP